jgi:hypothetical protein
MPKIFRDNFDQENSGIISSILNYDGLRLWTVANAADGGTVDLLGEWYPGYGNHLDLDGSSGVAAVLETKQQFSFKAGDVVTLKFLLGNNFASGDTLNSMRVSLGGAFSQVYTSEILGNGSNSNFLPIKATITIKQDITAPLIFAHDGPSDQSGLIIDDVQLDVESGGGSSGDTQAPVITIISVGGSDAIVSSRKDDNIILGTAERDGRPVTFVIRDAQGRETRQAGFAQFDNANGFQYKLDTSLLDPGTYTVVATQKDQAGNQGSSTPFSFRRANLNRAPKITLKGKSTVDLVSARAGTQEPLSALINRYFSVSDPDGDVVSKYRIKLSQAGGQPALELNFDDPEQRGLAATLKGVKYAYPQASERQSIGLQVYDGIDWSNSPEVDLVVHQAPDLRLTNAGFSWTFEGVPRPFKDWLTIGNDPDGDTINLFLFADRTTDPISGYFMLDGKKLDADAEKFYPISPEDIDRLMWVPGRPGTQDTIELRCQDNIGDVASVTSTFSTGRGPTGYMISNTNGFNHVTEGSTFRLNVQKLANFYKNTTLKWAIFGPSGRALAGGLSDFRGVPTGWNKIDFNANSQATVPLNLQTLKDGASEGSETARIWFYNEERNYGDRSRLLGSAELMKFNDGQLRNLGYSYLDVGIHDKPFYALGMSTASVEGERSTVSVARFGGGGKTTKVNLKAQTIQELYPGKNAYKSVNGLAIGGASKTAGIDFVSQNKTVTFNQDDVLFFDAPLVVDKVNEKDGEVFAWALYSNAAKPVLLDKVSATILGSKGSYSLAGLGAQGLWDLFGAVGGFFTTIGKSIGNAVNGVGDFFKTLSHPQKPVASLPGSEVQFIKTPIGMVALEKGALIAQGGGNLAALITKGLIAQGGANLIAQGGANLSKQLVDTLKAQGGANLVEQGGANLISRAIRELVAQGGANLVAQGGANFADKIVKELVAQGGDNLVAQGGANLIAQAVDTLVAQGGADLVAQGGGNLADLIVDKLVAQGGASANLVAQGGANLIRKAVEQQVGLSLVAQGGGNLADLIVDKLVAQGGASANLVAQGGDNLIPKAVDKLVAANLVAQGGANLADLITKQVAQGGAYLVAQGGANLGDQINNLLAQGGANLVAQGGANLVDQIAKNLFSQDRVNVVLRDGANNLSSFPIGQDGIYVVPSTAETYVSRDGGTRFSSDGYFALSQLTDLSGQQLFNSANPF